MTILFGGVPLLSPGDETGQPNDYSYRRDPGLADDSRWAGRPRMDWEAAARRHDPATIEGRLYAGFQRLIAIRRDEALFDGVATEIITISSASPARGRRAARPSSVPTSPKGCR